MPEPNWWTAVCSAGPPQPRTDPGWVPWPNTAGHLRRHLQTEGMTCQARLLSCSYQKPVLGHKFHSLIPRGIIRPWDRTSQPILEIQHLPQLPHLWQRRWESMYPTIRLVSPDTRPFALLTGGTTTHTHTLLNLPHPHTTSGCGSIQNGFPQRRKGKQRMIFWK